MNAIAYYGPEIFKMNLAVQRSGTFEWGVIPDGGRCSRTVWYRPSSSSIFKINILLKYVLKSNGRFFRSVALLPFIHFPDISNDFKRAESISMVKRF